MNGPMSFQYGGYELLCHAKAVDGGRFVPALVVSKQIWPNRPRAIDVPRGNHQSPQDAIDAAHAKGVEWVQNYG
jgi:hypothetical protein